MNRQPDRTSGLLLAFGISAFLWAAIIAVILAVHSMLEWVTGS